MGKRTITGNIAGKHVELTIRNPFGKAAKLSGSINGRPVDLNLEGYNHLSGELSDEDRNLVPYLRMLIKDKVIYDFWYSLITIMLQ